MPEQARAALTDADRIRVSTEALSATPRPTWLFVSLTLYIAAIPICVGGARASREWLLSRLAWMGVLVAVITVHGGLQAVATRAWRDRTGVALRLDVLPRRAIVPIAAGLPVLMVGAPLAFRVTGRPIWLIAASLTGVAVSVGCHLAFVRLHRNAAGVPEDAS